MTKTGATIQLVSRQGFNTACPPTVVADAACPPSVTANMPCPPTGLISRAR